MRLLRESLILIAIGLADLLFTLRLLAGKTAEEGNPVMAYYLRHGILAFVIVKLVLLFMPIFVAEWSRRYKPLFVKWMLRGAIAAYLGSYVVGFVFVNVIPISKERDYVPADRHIQAKMAEARRTK